jgi:RNA polymerase sigma-70 factor (ECF subfamily)
MAETSNELIPTRATLIQRLKCLEDQASWQDFFDTYRHLIHTIAVKSGMTEVEAQDVVQETLIAVAKNIPAFNYDASIGSFKGWLLNMTRWRIADQFRKRREHQFDNHVTLDSMDLLPTTKTDLEKVWDAEWETNLLQAAVAKIRRTLAPQEYQIFDFCVNKSWSAEKVATVFSIPTEQVYRATRNVTQTIKDEVQRLQNEII